jgi:hypothetical protein
MLGLIPEAPVTIEPKLGSCPDSAVLIRAGLTPRALPINAVPVGTIDLAAVVSRFVPMLVAPVTIDPTPGILVMLEGNAEVILLTEVGR